MPDNRADGAEKLAPSLAARRAGVEVGLRCLVTRTEYSLPAFLDRVPNARYSAATLHFATSVDRLDRGKKQIPKGASAQTLRTPAAFAPSRGLLFVEVGMPLESRE